MKNQLPKRQQRTEEDLAQLRARPVVWPFVNIVKARRCRAEGCREKAPTVHNVNGVFVVLCAEHRRDAEVRLKPHESPRTIDAELLHDGASS